MINPIKIKDINIDIPVLLCPMAGITDVPYRTMVESFGANFMYSEMISSVAMSKNSDKTLRMANLNSVNNSIAIQLAGSDIPILVTAAKMAEDLGSALIDINMGCPVKKVTKGIAGSALMREEVLAGKIIASLSKAVNIPITVKMRLGWDSSNCNSPQLAKIMEENGASLVTVHGRTRQQFYNGVSDWKAVAAVKNNVSIPVIVNGDIKNEEDAMLALEQSKADGVMIGRATYGSPWKIQQISHFLKFNEKLKEPTLEDKLKATLQHYELILDYYGSDKGLRIARKHLSWYTKGLKNSATLRAAINISEDIANIKSLIINCFEENHNFVEVHNIEDNCKSE